MSQLLYPKILCWMAVLSLAVTACKPKEAGDLLDASRALSAVTAAEGAEMAGAKKQITLIIPDANWGPASSVVRDCEAALKRRGFSVTTRAVHVGDPMSGGVGLKSAEFFDALEKSTEAGVIVSFAGAPLLSAAEFQRVPSTRPPILVIATVQLGTPGGIPGDRRQLAKLLDAGIIQAAIIDGGDPAAPKPAKLDAAYEIFAQHYRILRRPG